MLRLRENVAERALGVDQHDQAVADRGDLLAQPTTGDRGRNRLDLLGRDGEDAVDRIHDQPKRPA